jgi:tyrosine-specific transport protein
MKEEISQNNSIIIQGSGTLKNFKAVFTIAGTIVGAGVLALPTVMAQLGFFPGLVVLLLVGAAFLYTARYIGEATIEAGGPISLAGLAKKHFGTPGLVAMFAGVIIYIYGALIGYLSAGGQVIYDLSRGYVPQSIGMLIYFSAGAAVVYLGLRFLQTAEFILFGLVLALFLLLNYFAVGHVAAVNFLRTDLSKFFVVLGIAFFAYNGHSIIPSIAHQYGKEPKLFKKIVFLGVFVPICLYILWCFVAIGAVPYESSTPALDKLSTSTLLDAKNFGQPTTIPLGHLYGGVIIVIGFVFALFTTMTSFLGFGFSLAENFFDLLKKKLPWVLAVGLALVPPLVFNFGDQNVFLKALDIAGTYGAGIFAGVMPCLIILKVRKEKAGRPLYFREKAGPYVILTLFLAVLIYTTISFFI